MTQMDPTLVTQARTISSEVPFDVKDIFFSRTDKQGVILSANGLLQRISGFEWSEVIGAPQKILRHPDTPRAVFQLMWDMLKEDKPAGAYVKNRSKDGRYYWVYVIAAPTKDGYLSVQIKPTSKMLEKIKTMYRELCAAEAAGMKPEASAQEMLGKLKALGYDSYEVFQSYSLATEVNERCRRLDQVQDQVPKRFQMMSEAINGVQSETNLMTVSFNAIRTVPMNMRILASRLENAGGPISAISVNYGSMLDEMATWVRTFVEGPESTFARIRDAILYGQFLAYLSELQRETIQKFGKQSDTIADHVDVPAEHAILTEEAASYKREAASALHIVEVEATRLARSVLDMKRYVTGLSSTRMMCKIESAALSETGDALGGIVDQLDACQDEIEARLTKIVELNTVIQSNTTMLRALT
ncbi:PAS domain-containing protein [Puniceibacterium sediminis]|uniref:Aerotaxis receptor n=1 Tax=Puniceibacterium sediminis TaxID=1608407 RepID=A0A238VIR6_9RHOB|nr:PAS domain-containing protein [Puniceibacterium sediminis]SNR34290.1 aerotaxis receptor [Puniceibacterium sediminis]